MSEEHRKFVRLRSRLTTILTLPSTGQAQRALTRDVGEIGVCVVAEAPYEPGTPMAVEMKLPDYPSPVKFLAQVMWCKLTGRGRKGQRSMAEIGLRFVSIDPKARSLITQYAKLNALPSER